MEMEIIRIIDMPYCLNGHTTLDENGDYNIYINARLSFEGQLMALEHERKHIKRGDFASEKDVLYIESKLAAGV